MVGAPSGVPHPYPDHPLKGNHAAWHAALNAHPFLLVFTSCSISTFPPPLFITNLLPTPYETYPRGKHTGKTTHLQTDGSDRLLQVPSWSSRSRPSPRSVPLSVIRNPLSDIRYPEGGADAAVVVLLGQHVVLHGVPHGRFGWLSGPGGSEVWSTLSFPSRWSHDVLRWVPFLFRIKPSVMPKCNVVLRPSRAPKGNVERSVPSFLVVPSFLESKPSISKPSRSPKCNVVLIPSRTPKGNVERSARIVDGQDVPLLRHNGADL